MVVMAGWELAIISGNGSVDADSRCCSNSPAGSRLFDAAIVVITLCEFLIFPPYCGQSRSPGGWVSRWRLMGLRTLTEFSTCSASSAGRGGSPRRHLPEAIHLVLRYPEYAGAVLLTDPPAISHPSEVSRSG